MTDRHAIAAAVAVTAGRALTRARTTARSPLTRARTTARTLHTRVRTTARTLLTRAQTTARRASAAARRRWPATVAALGAWPSPARATILGVAAITGCVLLTVLGAAGDSRAVTAPASPATPPGGRPGSGQPVGCRNTAGLPAPSHLAAPTSESVRTGVRYQLLFAAATGAGVRAAATVRAGAGWPGPHDRHRGRLRIPHHPA